MLRESLRRTAHSTVSVANVRIVESEPNDSENIFAESCVFCKIFVFLVAIHNVQMVI